MSLDVGWRGGSRTPAESKTALREPPRALQRYFFSASTRSFSATASASVFFLSASSCAWAAILVASMLAFSAMASASAVVLAASSLAPTATFSA